jgi:CBS domain containing-hemolysin-like protein
MGANGRPRLLNRLRPAKEEAPEPSAAMARIIGRVHELADLELRDVMTPRVDVVYLTMPVAPEAVAEAVRDTGHSCFPVALHDLDDVDGVLFVNDLFRSSSLKRAVGVSLPGANEIARKVRRPPVMLPESLDVLEGLEEMRARRCTFALVLDEHGGVAGVVSTRDLLEPLVGDLADEFDDENEPTVARIREDRWLVDGQARVDLVESAIGLEIPEGEYVTIGGFLMDLAGDVLEEGRVISFGGYEFRVQSVIRRRVEEIVVARVASPPAATFDGEAPVAPE